MYDDILFPVSFYLLDDAELKQHGKTVASRFDARVHLLSLTLQDEGRRDIEEHRNAFDNFVGELEELEDENDVEVTTEFREEPVDYDSVAEAIVDEADDFDMVMMGHTKVSRERSGEMWTTADTVINTSPVPVFVIPLGAPRFRDVY
ncbi:MAG: universal stress protein [Halobacteria archaeon]|nr:universal stress protein [Halobacteria archaeon]